MNLTFKKNVGLRKRNLLDATAKHWLVVLPPFPRLQSARTAVIR